MLAAAALQGCVTSQFPLFDTNSAIADLAFTGHYIVTGIQEKPFEVDVYLNGNTYLITQNAKLAFIGTLHKSPSAVYLAQLRTATVGRKDNKLSFSGYTYFLVRKSGTGAELNFIPCTGDCGLTDVKDLYNFVSDAIDDFRGAEFVTAKKTAELGK